MLVFRGMELQVTIVPSFLIPPALIVAFSCRCDTVFFFPPASRLSTFAAYFFPFNFPVSTMPPVRSPLLGFSGDGALLHFTLALMAAAVCLQMIFRETSEW